MFAPLKQAFRVLRKDPGFTAVAICSLAIGIGATSAMFSFADGMLLQPLPVDKPDQVVSVNTATSAAFGANTAVSYPDYVDLRDRNRTFDGLIAAGLAPFGFSPDRDTLPRMKYGMYVSGNFFQVLGIEPSFGRGFRSDEDREGRDPVVVLGHDFWMSQFGGSRSVLGSRIRLSGIEFTVIGVAPKHFTSIDQYLRPALFVPLAMAGRIGQNNILNQRDVRWLIVKGRLKPGITVDQAQADLASVMAALESIYPQTNRNQRIRVATELQFRVQQSPPNAQMVVMLGLLAFCVLLVACANVAGLLLSRARARTREIAVRRAIGAGRGALIRQLLFENLLVAIAGGAAGIGVAEAAAAFFRSFPFPSDLPIVMVFAVNRRVLLFTLVASVLSTLLFGLAPAWRISNPDLVPSLKAAGADNSGKRRLWGRNAIVAGQVALSLVLLIVSAVMVQGFRDQLTQGPGFRTDHLFITGFDSKLARYSDDQSRRFYKDLLDRTRSAPGVRSAALSSVIPMISGDSVPVVPEGYQLPRGEQSIPVFNAYVSEGYFQTLGIPLRQGRGFLESDREGTPLVAVVNEHMAAHFWPNDDAVGKRFHLRGTSGPLVQVVGVAKLAKYFWIAEPPLDFVYLSFRQNPHSAMTMFTQSDIKDAGSLSPTVRGVVQSIDPDMPAFDVRTMHDLFTQRAIKTSNMLVEVVAALGLMGLALSIVGLYGLVAYSVSRRTREIGIRMAIGAGRGRVIWLVLKQGLTLGTLGVAAGLVMSIFVCRLVVTASWVATFKHVDPLIFIELPLLLLAIMLLGTFGPVRRATLVDPTRALRDE